MKRVRCEQVTLSDGSVAFARSAGPLTERDLRAIEGFNQILKCHDCLSREQCALDGMCLVSSGVREMDDAAQERPEQESDQQQHP